MGWLISIVGDSADLEELSKSFTSKKLYIRKDRDGFALGSEDFDTMSNSKEVSSRGKEIIASLNGAARLFLGIRKPLESGATIEVDASGKRSIFVETSTLSLHIKVGTVSVKIVRKDGAVEEFHPADPIPALITLTQKDENVSKVLRLYGSGNYDWVNLYRIYEVIENDMGGAASMAHKQWVTKKSIDRFTHTANCPAVTGDESRHGVRVGQQAPSDPMTIAEAKSFIENIIHNWLRLKSI